MVSPLLSFGSTYSEPNELVGSFCDGAFHLTSWASASGVRHTPPPAAATHARQPACFLPQLGSMAIAVTRPEFVVGVPVPVCVLKNCVASAATSGVTGPSAFHCCEPPRLAARKSAADLNELAGAALGRDLKSLAPWSATRSLT